MSPEREQTLVERCDRPNVTATTQIGKAKCYTPQLRPEIVSRLYHRAKAEGVPMTTLANQLMEKALGSIDTNRGVARI